MTYSLRLPFSSGFVILFTLSALWFGGGCATGPQSAKSKTAGQEFVGTWTLTDEDKAPFDLIVREDGTAITNWSKGESGAKGEFGRWNAEPGKITVSYDDGWTDIITRKGKGYWKTSYEPGAKLTGKPSNTGSAKRVKGKTVPFVGVWETTAVVNNAPCFIALKSNGTAQITVSPKEKGTWKVAGDAAVIQWNDGWVTRIRSAGDSVTCEVWAPDNNKYPEAPTATHPAWMVGTE